MYATAAAELVGVGRLEAPVINATKKSQQQQEARGNPGGFLDGLPRMNE